MVRTGSGAPPSPARRRDPPRPARHPPAPDLSAQADIAQSQPRIHSPRTGARITSYRLPPPPARVSSRPRSVSPHGRRTMREDNEYLLGTDDDELRRLGFQHQVWAGE